MKRETLTVICPAELIHFAFTYTWKYILNHFIFDEHLKKWLGIQVYHGNHLI